MSDLNDRGKEALAFLNAACDDKTIQSRGDHWVENVLANREHLLKPNPPLKGLIAFVVAAGPSLRKNVASLREVGHLGVILCVDAAFRYLMEHGVVPDYCVTIDGDGRILSMLEGADTSRTTLICTTAAAPAVIAAWKGPKFFLRPAGGNPELDKRLNAAAQIVRVRRDLKAGDEINPFEDVKLEHESILDILASGGNVTTYAHSFALQLLRAVKVIFVGADYAWSDSGEFYAGAAHKELAKERIEGERELSHPVYGGGDVATNFTLWHFKEWHDNLAGAYPTHAVNATEGGILGVGRDGKALPGWEHLSLAEAIAKYAPARAPLEAVPA